MVHYLFQQAALFGSQQLFYFTAIPAHMAYRPVYLKFAIISTEFLALNSYYPKGPVFLGRNSAAIGRMPY